MRNVSLIRTTATAFYLVSYSLLADKANAGETVHVESALIKIVESVNVSAAASGLMTEMHVKEGDLVESGSLMAQLDDKEAGIKSRVAKLQADIAKKKAGNDVLVRLAQKTHNLAISELDRAERVNRGIPNSISAREINILKLTVDKTELEVEQTKLDMEIMEIEQGLKQAELELADHAVTHFSVRAPINGMVVHVERRAGEWVTAGDLVVRVVRVDRVRAEGLVQAEQAARGLKDRTAHIMVNATGSNTNQVSGRVIFVSPEANPVDGRVRIWAEFENKDFKLHPGLRGSMWIDTSDDPPTAPAK